MQISIVALLAMLFLPWAAALIVGIVLLVEKKLLPGRILLTLWFIIPVALITFLGAEIVMLMKGVARYAILWCCAMLLMTVLFLCFLWGVLKKKKVYLSIGISGILLAAVYAGNIGYDKYMDSIPTLEESVNLLESYSPYGEGTKVYVPDEEATLRLTEDIPRMDGATALYPVYSAFARATYPKELLAKEYNVYLNEYLTCSTTTGAYQRLADGEADVIFAAAPSEEQLEYAKEQGTELVLTPIGREGFVFFVNSENPLEDISVEEIRGIYSGEITKWEELGVSGLGKIRAFQRSEGSGSQSRLIRLMDGKKLMEPPKEEKIDTMAGIIDQVSDYKNFKNAIGFSFRFYSTEMLKNNQIKLLSIEGMAPAIENIENDTYPLASEFYAVTRTDASENTRRLVEWILGEQGQDIVEGTGYTPVGRKRER